MENTAHVKLNWKKKSCLLSYHPFKTLAFFRGGRVKNLSNLPTDSSKKTADGRGVGVKNREKFADVLNRWSLMTPKASCIAFSDIISLV